MTEASKLEEMEALARRLDDAVANFLDADSAWDADECSEREFLGAHAQMKNELYATRAARKALLANVHDGKGST
jgi:hypothetical protein